MESGDYDPTLDFGYEPVLGSLGDFVWEDFDADGLQDAGEPGIQGVSVELFDGTTMTSLGTTTTGPTGEYLFTGLPEGGYYVVFGDVAGYTASPNNTGDDAIDSDADQMTGQTPTYTLGLGEHNPTIDAGYYQAAGLGDYVWLDLDGDGEQDATESGLEGVVVELYGATGNFIASTTTDANGFYEFVDLLPGTYTVQVPATGPDSEAPTNAD